MSECIFLPRVPNGSGYVNVYVDGRLVGAHVVAWEKANGRKVPAGHVLDHTCHNVDLTCPAGAACPHRACVNPAHLDAVTQRENTLRSPFSPSAINARKTECIHGHPFTPTNTYINSTRKRCCRTCNRLKQRAFRAAGYRSPRTCSIDGCTCPKHARGWCSMHYHRWRRTGEAVA